MLRLSIMSGLVGLGEAEQLSVIQVLRKGVYALLTKQQKLVTSPCMF